MLEGLNQARIKLIVFKSQLRSYLYGASTNKEHLLEPCKCALGSWIEEYKDQYGNSLELAEVDKQHMRLHFKTSSLINMFDSGNISEAKNGMDKFEEISADVVAAMDHFEQTLKAVRK